jgi:hypothetical protein
MDLNFALLVDDDNQSKVNVGPRDEETRAWLQRCEIHLDMPMAKVRDHFNGKMIEPRMLIGMAHVLERLIQAEIDSQQDFAEMEDGRSTMACFAPRHRVHVRAGRYVDQEFRTTRDDAGTEIRMKRQVFVEYGATFAPGAITRP